MYVISKINLISGEFKPIMVVHDEVNAKEICKENTSPTEYVYYVRVDTIL